MSAELIISISALILSLISFVFTFRKKYKEGQGKLRIEAWITEDKNELQFNLTNISYDRIVTILAVEILYGATTKYNQTVLKVSFKPKELNESQTFSNAVKVTDLKKAAAENKTEQRFYHVLWLRVITTSSGKPIKKIIIPENYFPDSIHFTAKEYMAADDLFGFKLMEPKYNNYHRPFK